MKEPKGLYGKFEVYKDGKKITTPCFVLRYDRDPHAQRAVLAYIDSVMGENKQLAADLLRSLSNFVDMPEGEVPF